MELSGLDVREIEIPATRKLNLGQITVVRYFRTEVNSFVNKSRTWYAFKLPLSERFRMLLKGS